MWIGVAIAIVGAFAASYFDVKTREIPNWLTLGMIATGLILSSIQIFYGAPWVLIVLPLALSFPLIWLMWRAGLFGGGDAKLLMGIVSLTPLFPDGSSFIPTFFLMIALSTFMQFFIFGVQEAIKRKDGKALVFALTPAGIACFVYFITHSFLISIFFLAIAADAASPFLPYRKKVEVSDEIRGEMLAETIGIMDGNIVRIAEKPSFLLKIFSRKDKLDEVIAAPSHTGISADDIKKLKVFCSEVYVFPSRPMAPAIFAALLIALLTGNIIPTR